MKTFQHLEKVYFPMRTTKSNFVGFQQTTQLKASLSWTYNERIQKIKVGKAIYFILVYSNKNLILYFTLINSIVLVRLIHKAIN